ncbi:MAG: hypothetical protein HOB98_10050 [Gammaproteobacteria bacterium]|nr:hypothetical protein [Gammaproteobacteria bacterium]MBT3868856.1 hypothetical protein [Gammaproteobacteria bacterium]MBT4379192.1 hypothetical protein [Gammaproteobacteria bacterium]MBT4616778.1 hypothetical protein [Gammaproteobacteria bacterium]MBT5197983.1 hypothetical protein [Gammaproteobacteria bacterium]
MLSPEAAEKSREVLLESMDLVLMFPVKFAMGYAYGSDFIPITPNKNAIWWAGLGLEGLPVSLIRETEPAFLM